MKGRGLIALPSNRVDVTETGVGCLDDFDIQASFGDYGRSTNPTIIATAGDASFSFEFSSPDEARKLGERLFDLARKAEEKAETRGPAYRAKLARDEALDELRALTARIETAMDMPGAVEPLGVLTAVFGKTDNREPTK